MNYSFLLFILFFGLCACSETSTSESVEETASAQTQAPRQEVIINTRMGDITVALYNETPKHRDNFLKLVKDGFYDSLLIHRIQKNFIIQAGDPESKGTITNDTYLGKGGLDYTIKPEINGKFINRMGALVAYYPESPKKGGFPSSACQFMIIHGNPLRKAQLQKAEENNDLTYTDQQKELYLNYGGIPDFDGKFTVFGEVVLGLDLLEDMMSEPTLRSQNPRWPDRPIRDLRMTMRVKTSQATVIDSLNS